MWAVVTTHLKSLRTQILPVIIYCVLSALSEEKALSLSPLPAFAPRVRENNQYYVCLWNLSGQGCLVEQEMKYFTVSRQRSLLRYAGLNGCLKKCENPVHGSDISMCRQVMVLKSVCAPAEASFLNLESSLQDTF